MGDINSSKHELDALWPLQMIVKVKIKPNEAAKFLAASFEHYIRKGNYFFFLSDFLAFALAVVLFNLPAEADSSLIEAWAAAKRAMGTR